MFNDNRNFNGQAHIVNGFQSAQRPMGQPMQRQFTQPAPNARQTFAPTPAPVPAEPAPVQEDPIQAAPVAPAPAPKPAGKSSEPVIMGLGDLSFLDDEEKAEAAVAPDTTIKVFGVGGGGSNAVSCMFDKNSTDAELVVLNTDYKHLKTTSCNKKILLGLTVTRGKGAGAEPEQGKKAAEDEATKNLILNELHKDGIPENPPIDMLFLTAGMGGGTGTGASPVIAKLAKEMGILTVAVVTKPFEFEGAARMSIAEDGISKLREYVDAIIVVPNEKLCALDSGNLSMQAAFDAGNQILMDAVSSICNIITNTSYINLDFADVRKVLANSGDAHIGIGITSPEAIQMNGNMNMNPGMGAPMMPQTANYALLAAQNAVDSPLLETTIKGADGLIISYSASRELPLRMLREANDFIRQQAAPNATIIFGFNPDASMGNNVAITVIATRKGGLVEDTPLQNDEDITDPIRSMDYRRANNVGERVMPDNNAGAYDPRIPYRPVNEIDPMRTARPANHPNQMGTHNAAPNYANLNNSQPNSVNVPTPPRQQPLNTTLMTDEQFSLIKELTRPSYEE